MRPYTLSFVLLLTSTALVFGCKSDGPADPKDAALDVTVDVIYPPDDDAPHCIDGILVPDTVRPGSCKVVSDCDGVFDPMPTCRAAICDEGECALTLAEDDTVCDDGNVCTEGTTCQAGECLGGETVCECTTDADCVKHNDGDLCNGSFVCDTELDEPVCVVDPTTIVTCEQPADPCKRAECDPKTGACEEQSAEDGTPCDTGDPCTEGDHCVAGACQPGEQNICACPEGMIAVGESFCIDQYEASRPDATPTYSGQDNSRATSRVGVLPWMPVEYAAGRDACGAAGKRLCTPGEFEGACSGPTHTAYTYGNTYEPTTCNGIDTFCRCDSGACAALDICPYPHCYNRGPDGTIAQGCGADLKPMRTGSFPGCTNEYGAFDLSGNVWELVDRGDGVSWYAGGAYNCFDAVQLHRCGALQRNISARGFRCCADYGTGTPP